jgi:hypothetical protein
MQSESPTRSPFVVIAFFFEAGLGAVAIAVGWFLGFDPLATLPIAWEATPALFAAFWWGAAAAIPLFLGLLLIERIRWSPFLKLQDVVETRLRSLFTPLSLFELAAISIAAGFGEETLFRGLIQAGLAEWFGSPNGVVWGVLAAAVLFGVCHWITPTYAVLATLVGIYLGALFVLTGSLLAPLVAHAAYDFAALVYMTRHKNTTDSPED